MKRFAILGVLIAVIMSLFSAPVQAFKDPDPKMVLPGATTVGAPESASVGSVPTLRDPQPDCHDLYRWGQAHHNDGSAGNDEWWITGSVHNRYCREPDGTKWVRPSFTISGYNQEGTHMDCSDLASNGLIWVIVNWYFWDRAGRNYNPGPVYLPCREDTTASKTQDYITHNPPKLYWVEDSRGHIHAPNWKFTWKIVKYNGIFEGHGTVQGKFRPCSGRGYTLCPQL